MNSHIDIAGRKLSDLPRVFMQPVWAELIERLVEDKAVGAKRITIDPSRLTNLRVSIKNGSSSIKGYALFAIPNVLCLSGDPGWPPLSGPV